jgi:hypothetical protein
MKRRRKEKRGNRKVRKKTRNGVHFISKEKINKDREKARKERKKEKERK